MNEFEVYLVSNGSMTLYPTNTLASFTNYFKEPLQLEGDWQVALSEITFPLSIKNISSKKTFFAYKGRVIPIGEIRGMFDKLALIAKRREEFRKLSEEEQHHLRVVYGSEQAYYRHGLDEISDEDPVLDGPGYVSIVEPGLYDSAEALLAEIESGSNLPLKDYTINPSTGRLELTFENQGEGFEFYDNEIPNILGFERKPHHLSNSGASTYVGSKLSSENPPGKIVGDFPVDISAGTQLIFIYLNIIDYQQVADVKTPILRVIDSKRKLRNGRLHLTQTVETKTFTDLQYKKVLQSSVQSIHVELRTESGLLVPFFGTGKVVLTLKFRKVT